ncbi:MAG: GGDEF domain-containing phosphodiesterase, partial [Pseudomonadota bacterium]
FILILTSAPDLDAAKSVGRRLIDRIGLPVDVEGQSAEVGASVGITTIPAGCEKSLDTLLKEADVALYDVKNAGRGAVSVFTRELEDREARVKQLIRDIEPAIARGEFVPFYQLQVDVATGMVFGAEVLGRWQHPELGLILPQQFLEVAERAQLVEKIDAAIFAQALDNLAAWSRQGIAPPHLSLNLTFRKLTGGNFAERFRDEVDARGLHPSQIIFELIELILIDEETVAIHEAAEMLHRNGFKLAIDDFGTGRASLMSLLSVPASIVKIDRSFVSNLDQFPKKMLMTEAIMNIARALGLNVIAEGTETEKECAILLGLGCTIFQGFLFNRPEPALRFERTLRDAEWRAAFPAAVDMRAVFDSSA